MLFAYIDESGQRGVSAKATDHFVLSAVMFRAHAVPYAEELLKRMRIATRRGEGHELHFNKLANEHRHVVSSMLGQETWLRVSSVVVCKNHLPHDDLTDDERYLHAFRLLLERVSWLAKDYGETAYYTLAHIQRFKLSTLRAFEARLRSIDTEIRWTNLDPAGGQLNHPKTLELLQLADIAASSTGIAFNPPMNTGVAEPAYLMNLSPALYRRAGGKLTSYGLKMYPWWESTKAAYPWVATL
jgi:hypothetical protein